MKVKVYNKNLEVAEEIDLNSKIFDIKPEIGLIQQAVRVQMANARSPIGNTKTKGEVRGGGRKPWKQKGTGNARAGSTRSPLWRHGGITFGPRANRNYELKMNRKQWRKALYMVLSDKVGSNNFLVMSELTVTAPKTKEMAGFLKNVSDKVNKAKNFLVVTTKTDKAVQQATSNLKNAKVINANSLNIVDLMKYETMVVPKSAIEVIEKTYLK